MNKNKIILFDLDGTLIDSTDAILSTFYHSFKELNFDFNGNDEDIKSLIGYPLDIMYAKLGIEESKVWDFVDAYKNRYRNQLYITLVFGIIIVMLLIQIKFLIFK